jgi:hypothetical protein
MDKNYAEGKSMKNPRACRKGSWPLRLRKTSCGSAENPAPQEVCEEVYDELGVVA